MTPFCALVQCASKFEFYNSWSHYVLTFFLSFLFVVHIMFKVEMAFLKFKCFSIINHFIVLLYSIIYLYYMHLDDIVLIPWNCTVHYAVLPNICNRKGKTALPNLGLEPTTFPILAGHSINWATQPPTKLGLPNFDEFQSTFHTLPITMPSYQMCLM